MTSGPDDNFPHLSFNNQRLYQLSLLKLTTKFVVLVVLLQLEMPRIMKIFYKKKLSKRFELFLFCVIKH